MDGVDVRSLGAPNWRGYGFHDSREVESTSEMADGSHSPSLDWGKTSGTWDGIVAVSRRSGHWLSARAVLLGAYVV